MNNKLDISVVVPLYNEAESLPELVAWIDRVAVSHGYAYEVILVDDGSSDGSWEVVESLREKYPAIRGIGFARNYGKSAALYCGFAAAEGEVVITMDADLQDDINVIDRFVDAYEHGVTPNPCIDCNRYLKFEKLYLRMQEMQMDTIVTGHYARVAYDETSGRYLLKKGLDGSKDQSYVLYNLTQEQLAHTQFPVGELSKHRVREIAEEHGFLNADKPDSQDICFVPDGDYAAFIERYTGKQYPHGDFIDESGRVLGEHQGLIRYTIGQRRGLGIAAGKPVYVCRKSVADNTVTLSDSASLFSTRLTARDFNWIAFAQPPEHPIRVAAKPRNRAKEAPATAEAHPDGTVTITFDQPQRAITTGQAVVLYDGDTVIGGGTICQ